MKVEHFEDEKHVVTIDALMDSFDEYRQLRALVSFLYLALPDQIEDDVKGKRFVVRITPNGWIEYKIAVHAVNMIKDMCRI